MAAQHGLKQGTASGTDSVVVGDGSAADKFFDSEVGVGSTFYFVRDSGLHSIEINSGNQASRVGTDSWDNVTAMTGASGRLFLVDGSTLYSVAASGGARTKIGTDSWSGVTAMALVGSDLYLVDGTTVWKVTP